MRITKTFNIKIEARLPSKFQLELAENSLRDVMESWMSFMQASHKENDIFIRQTGE